MPDPITISIRPGFHPGELSATPGVLARFPNGVGLGAYLARHLACDWGDLGDDDKAANTAALDEGSRILSAYDTAEGPRIWILTEAKDDEGQRSRTTILLPEEY